MVTDGVQPQPSGSPLTRATVRHPLSACCDDCTPGELGARRDEQVIFSTGQLYYQESIITLPGPLPLPLALVYVSHCGRGALLGQGWRLNLEQSWLPLTSTQGYQHRQADGLRTDFLYQRSTNQLLDQSIPATQVAWREPDEGEARSHDQLVFSLTDSQGIIKRFQYGRLIAMIDTHGNRIDLSYDHATGQLIRLENNAGSVLTCRYNAQGQLTDILDHGGRTWHLGYDDTRRLSQLTLPEGGRRHYRYHTSGTALLSRVTNSAGDTLLEADYHAPSAQADYHQVAHTWSRDSGQHRHYQYNMPAHWVKVNHTYLPP